MKTVASIVLNNFKNDSRVQKECLTLKQAGYLVTVVALHEFPLCEKEVVNGVNVHRIKLSSRGWPKKKIVQIIKYFEFLFRAIKQYREHDIIHCHDLNALPVGVLIKIFFNRSAKVVYDAHEYETEIYGLSNLQKKIARLLERLLIGHADATLTVSNAIADEYVRLYQIKKPALVLNTPRFQISDNKNLFREQFNIPKGQKVYLYQGNLAKGRGIEILLETFTDQLPSLPNQPVLVVLGYGELKDKILSASEKYENIFFLDAVNPDVLLDYTSSADYGFSTIEDSCLSFRYCLPNKMFEYIMAGVPVIVSNLPEMRRIVTENQLGIVCEDSSVDGMKKVIRLAESISGSEYKHKLEKAKSIYNWEEQEKRLLKLYEEVLCAE